MFSEVFISGFDAVHTEESCQIYSQLRSQLNKENTTEKADRTRGKEKYTTKSHRMYNANSSKQVKQGIGSHKSTSLSKGLNYSIAHTHIHIWISLQ